MNDPWNVKCVRQSDQYVSCLKLNGVPLLPPVLSKECRKEMQYYKLLAKEVEKRISLLTPYVQTDSDEDKTDAPELPESENTFQIHHNELENFNVNIDKLSAVTNESANDCPFGDTYNDVTSSVTIKTNEDALQDSSKLIIDVSLSINESAKFLESVKKTPSQMEVPERDCDHVIPAKELLMDMETVGRRKHRQSSYSDRTDTDLLLDSFMIPLKAEGPSSLSSKSFTGSLNDLHSESGKDPSLPKLIRQSSYTVLKPSPQLLAHLEVQSLNTGVEMSAISMSESSSNIHSPKKRRSWDLESAKIKWSSMALELKKSSLTSPKPAPSSPTGCKATPARSVTKSATSPCRSKPSIPEKTRRSSVPSKNQCKSDPIKPKPFITCVRNMSRTIVKNNDRTEKKDVSPHSPKRASPPLVPKPEDPAVKVRELYEKIQKQQLLQMASLIEKQKREQQMLQQVFEEQNNLLYKQLKTIVPETTIEAKSAWGDKVDDEERGPVSLSQLISSPVYRTRPSSPTYTATTNSSNPDSPKRSAARKQIPRSGANKMHSTTSQPTNGSKTRTHSPVARNASRKLNYETSGSPDRGIDPPLTDRTNDTMADINISFPSDSDDVFNETVKSLSKSSPRKKSPVLGRTHQLRSTDSAIRSLEETIQNTMNSMRKPTPTFRPPSTKEREAASVIVAYAKGYLVRRLMRTERVQTAVQTVRDALLCALQLHTDRNGIRGADVDLHRRLIQQITAACYTLHDTFVSSTPAERCAVIATDRARRRSLAARQPALAQRMRQGDVMSQSHSGSFPPRAKRLGSTLMTQSNYGKTYIAKIAKQ